MLKVSWTLPAALAAGALAVAAPSAGGGPVAAAAGLPLQFSAPATLSTCAIAGPAAVAFPSEGPTHATGPGAIVWSAPSACPGGAGPRVSRIGSADAPGPPALALSAAGHLLAPQGPLAVSAAPHGRIVIVGASPRAGARSLAIEGAAGGPFTPLANLEGPAASAVLTRAYLGDVGLGSAGDPGTGAASDGPSVYVQRYFGGGFARRLALGTGARGQISSLTVALDYRSDALAVWVQGGVLYARDLPASGARRTTERLARIAGHATVSALLSDNNRAIVAWSDHGAGVTRTWLDRSATGPRFPAPKLLETAADADGLPVPPASPRLVRLSSESVMMAWAGTDAGHWVIRTAPIDERGIRTVATIAPAAGADALLADIATGPRDDAVVLWSEPQLDAAGAPDPHHQALLAARGTEQLPGRSLFGQPALLAPPAAVGDGTVAVDPRSDRAVAVWRGPGGLLEDSISTSPDSR